MEYRPIITPITCAMIARRSVEATIEFTVRMGMIDSFRRRSPRLAVATSPVGDLRAGQFAFAAGAGSAVGSVALAAGGGAPDVDPAVDAVPDGCEASAARRDVIHLTCARARSPMTGDDREWLSDPRCQRGVDPGWTPTIAATAWWIRPSGRSTSFRIV